MEVHRLGRFLRSSGIVDQFPDDHRLVTIENPGDVRALNSQLSKYRYRVAGRNLIELMSHHPMEDADALGRPTNPIAYSPRQQVELIIEFIRVGGKFDAQDYVISAGAQTVGFKWVGSVGSLVELESEQERTFREFITNPDFGSSNLEGQLGVVSAGLVFVGQIGVIDHETRLSGQLSVSSFVDGGLDRAVTRLPLEIDGFVDEWYTVGIIDTTDLNALLSLKNLSWDLKAGAERVLIRVKIRPR